jgi:hypothetical protein
MARLHLLAVGAAAIPAVAQTPPVREPIARAATPAAQPSARILGVFDDDSGQPVAGVEVMDMLTGTSALTTATGTVSLAFLSTGGSLVRIRKVGYAVQTMPIPVSASDTTPITVLLKRATQLPAVVTRDSAPHYISPALRGFEQRRASATSGYFIDEKMLRKEDNRPLGNLLIAHAPGVTVKQVGSAAFLLKSPRCSNGGQPEVYVDGVALAHVPDIRWPGSSRVRGSADTRDIPIDLSQFQVSDLGAVEYYPDNATIPAQFGRTSAGCGALMLWSRER